MTTLIAYQKHITAEVTRELVLPMGPDLGTVGTELATVDGVTYVYLPAGSELPSVQPLEISASIKEVALTQSLRDAIAAASPHVALIRERVAEKIVARYSTADEIKLLRTAPSHEFEVYNEYVEDCRAWGREQKAAIGLEV